MGARMWRTVLAVVLGLVAWALVVSVFNVTLEHWFAGYKQAEPVFAFTLPMKVARLLEAAVTSVIAGAVAGAVAPASRYAGWITGAVVLALFLPIHVQLFDRFPIWYHLAFLVPLAPLVALGAALVTSRRHAAILPAGV